MQGFRESGQENQQSLFLYRGVSQTTRHASHFTLGRLGSPRNYGITADSRTNKVDTLNGFWIKSLQPISKHLFLSMGLPLIARMGTSLVYRFDALTL